MLLHLFAKLFVFPKKLPFGHKPFATAKWCNGNNMKRKEKHTSLKYDFSSFHVFCFLFFFEPPFHITGSLVHYH